MLASPRSPAAYLANLKPVLDAATAARTAWLRALNDMAQSEDIGERSDEVVQIAVRSREQFNEAKRILNQMTAPEMYRDMERSLDGWLEALASSCDQLATARPPISVDQVNAARRRLRDAAQQADKFNAERAAVITVSGAPPGDAPEEPGEQISNNKRLIVLTALGLVLMIVALYFAFGALGTSNTGLRTPTSGTPGAGQERRVFTRSEILDRLKQEIATRRVAFLNPDVRLVEPDRVIVTGQIQGPTGLVPVEAEMQLGVTDSGKPKVTALNINATGVSVPQGALDALNKRTEEANKTLPEQLAPDQFVRRLYVEKDTIIAEIDKAGAPSKPGDAAATPAKPGDAAAPAGKPATKP
jgi:hypothetical protein